MNIYQLKVTLRDIHPPVWRRLRVPAAIPLGGLHRVIQAAMGWSDSHLHVFRVGDKAFGISDLEINDGVRSEQGVRLDQVAKVGDSFLYDYDFGDGWEHDVLVEEVLAAGNRVSTPRCIAGERSCPPEDCGGIPGYEHMLKALGDPADPEHKHYIKWIGGGFDPESFDLEEVNQRLWMAHR